VSLDVVATELVRFKYIEAKTVEAMVTLITKPGGFIHSILHRWLCYAWLCFLQTGFTY